MFHYQESVVVSVEFSALLEERTCKLHPVYGSIRVWGENLGNIHQPWTVGLLYIRPADMKL